MFSPIKILDDDTNIQVTEEMIDLDALTMNGSLLNKSDFLKQRRAYQHEWGLLTQEPKSTGWMMLERVLRQLPNLKEVDVISTDQIGFKEILGVFPGHGALQFTHIGVGTLHEFLKAVGSEIRQLNTIRIFDQDDTQWFTGGPSVRTSRRGPGRSIPDQYLDINAISSGLEHMKNPDYSCQGLDPVTASLKRAAYPFPPLKTLEIYGRRASTSSYHRFCDALCRILTMPQVTANIERLAIGCEGTSERIDKLQEVFGSTEFPRLRNLGLHWWFSLDLSYMADLLIRHRATLQSIYFVKVVAGEALGAPGYRKDWNIVFDSLRGTEFPHLRQFDLSSPEWTLDPAPELMVSATGYILRQHNDSPFEDDTRDTS